MKRMFAIPFVSAALGGGVVAAVIAAAGGLGTSQKTVTTVQDTDGTLVFDDPAGLGRPQRFYRVVFAP